MATTFTEGKHPGEFLISEASNTGSRQLRTFKTQAPLFVAGLILGTQLLGAATAVAAGGNTGNATSSAVTVPGASAVSGAYTVLFTAATKFNVYRPDGTQIQSGTTGVAYSDDLAFTITAGATPMVAGDSFTITVAAGDLKVRPLSLTATDGTAIPSGISYDNVDASAADVVGVVIENRAEVKDFVLTYPAGATTNQKAAINALLYSKLNISVRKGV